MKILQIIPAEGWYALYDEGETRAKLPLNCWALVETDPGERSIVGMVSGSEKGVQSANFSNFVCYDKLTVK